MNDTQKREFKNRLYEQFARIGKMLSSARRLELLDVLVQGERTVEELAGETGMSVANTSQHLQTLRASMLVDIRRNGTYAYYRLADQKVYELCMSLRSIAELQLADMNRIINSYLSDRQSLQAITAGELMELITSDQVTVLDVRPPQEYQAGHIRGARNIPVMELEKRLTGLSADKAIVAYCRGKYCVYADEAVKLLQSKGFHAHRLEEGFPEWRHAGLPVTGPGT